RGGERACGNQVDDGGTAWVIRGSQRPGPRKNRPRRGRAGGRGGAAGAARIGGRGVVRDRGDTRGRGAGGRGPRPGRRTDPAGPRSGPVLAAGGGVAARRLRTRPAAPPRAGSRA